MENKGLKIIGAAVVVMGLLSGVFLVGCLATGGKSGAEPEIVPTPTESQIAAVEDDTNDAIILVGDEQDDGEDAVDETGEPAQQPQAPVEPAEPAPAPDAPEPTPVNEAPYVVSLSPDEGDVGVRRDASIVVTFSEPMNEEATEAAFQINTIMLCLLPSTLSWNDDATALTFDPCGLWKYGDEIAVTVMNSAEDESGLEMAADFESDFRILQQSTIKLRSVDAYDGYVYAPNIQAQEHAVSEGQTFFVGTWSRGFLTFDLSEMPQNAIDIEEAELRIKQKDHQDGAYETPGTGGLSVWTVHYGTLTNDDFNKAPNENPCGCEYGHTGWDATDGWKSQDVTILVQDDWAHADERDYLSQMRLAFAKSNGQGSSISAEFHSGKGVGVARPYILVTYTHP